MSYFLSKTSTTHLGTCHKDIQTILREAIKYTDFSVTCGYRNRDDQNKAYENDRSSKQFPYSNHNVFPSKAVDIAPYPIDYKDIGRFQFLAGVILTIAQQKRIKLRWGGHWKSFKDYPHFELYGPKYE